VTTAPEHPEETMIEHFEKCVPGGHEALTKARQELTARQARRDALLHLTRRMLRGALLPSERDLLATHVEEALRDGDQARAQRDTAAASLADLRNDLYAERRAHEQHRLALSKALSLGTSAPWDAITERAQTVQAAAERAEAAERNARRAEKRCEDLRGESLRRGKEVVERNERIAQLERRAERAEADLKRVHEQRKELAAERYRFALRAERAEATLTRVRNMPRLCGDCQINLRAFLDAEQQAPAGALGDPQPATEPEPRERPAEQPRCSCAGVGYGGKGDCPVHDAEREQPAEPDGAALWAAIRDHAAADLTWWDAVRHRLGHPEDRPGLADELRALPGVSKDPTTVPAIMRAIASRTPKEN
jgi:hypothetical protein